MLQIDGWIDGRDGWMVQRMDGWTKRGSDDAYSICLWSDMW